MTYRRISDADAARIQGRIDARLYDHDPDIERDFQALLSDRVSDIAEIARLEKRLSCFVLCPIELEASSDICSAGYCSICILYRREAEIASVRVQYETLEEDYNVYLDKAEAELAQLKQAVESATSLAAKATDRVAELEIVLTETKIALDGVSYAYRYGLHVGNREVEHIRAVIASIDSVFAQGTQGRIPMQVTNDALVAAATRFYGETWSFAEIELLRDAINTALIKPAARIRAALGTKTEGERR